MASGDQLDVFTPLGYEPASSNYATLDTRNQHPVLDFDASTDESAVWSSVLPANYDGGGVTVKLHYAMTSATSGDVVLTAAFERIGSGSQDTDSDGFATAKSVTSTVDGTSGNVKVATITFTNGAEMDSVAASEEYRIKITRDADNGSDTATGDLELRKVSIEET